MHTSMLLEMAADGYGDRIAVGSKRGGISYTELLDKARRAAVWASSRNVTRVGLVDVNTEAVPILLYGAGLAGMPFVPINYRLADDQLKAILARTAPAVVVVEDPVPGRVGEIEGVELLTRSQFFKELDEVDAGAAEGLAGYVGDPEDIAILLYTSGTTGEPKAAVLRHKHLASYVLSTVEFMSADEDDAALVSVPPYHVAGTSAVLTSVHAGRRLVYLPAFTPEAWVATARDEGATQAMVVPTMLGRVLDVLESEDERLTSLRHLSYGGGRMPLPTVERALTLLPHVNFVNAYGLTETSSTAAVLGPEDHREAMASSDPAIRARLQSVGRPIPTLELEIRDAEGKPVATGEVGEIYIRGEQVAGEYLGRASVMEDGWFPTRDGGYLDEHGFLYLTGRLDDVIVRGAENISPGEIEDVLAAHEAVTDAAVVGVPDVEWGEKVVAAVVLSGDKKASENELKEWVRAQLRSSKIPENIEFRDELPYNDTGKLLRRVLKTELGETYGTGAEGDAG